MANYKVAYGRKENMDLAIERGIIPPGCIILTEDSAEMYFYDLDRELKIYEERYKFESIDSAEDWVNRYNCRGQILSVHEGDRCNLYVVNYENKLSKISSTSYKTSNKNPTELDYNYDLMTHWINEETGDVFILVSVKNEVAQWLLLNSKSDLSYTHSQETPSELWMINHNLGKYPTVCITGTEGDVVIGEISYLDNNNIELKFNSAFKGYAYLN